MLAVRENMEVLTLDALYGEAPGLLAVLGTAAVTLDMSRFYVGRREVMRALRREWPEARYGCHVEYTTGDAERSGGDRRPHWNLLFKGIPAEDFEAAGEVIVSEWCRRVPTAAPEAQYVGAVRNEGGLIRYLSQHFGKVSQRPPEGFHGHRFVCSRDFLWLPTPDARAAARESLAAGRRLWKACQLLQDGGSAEDVEAFAAALNAEAEGRSWDLVEVVKVNDLVVDVRGFDQPHRGRSWRPPAPCVPPPVPALPADGHSARGVLSD